MEQHQVESGGEAVNRPEHPGMSGGVRFARWLAAVLMITYGFAKLTGSQFTVIDSEVTKPLGEVSGFWLTWYYFGSSTVYGTVIALVVDPGRIELRSNGDDSPIVLVRDQPT